MGREAEKGDMHDLLHYDIAYWVSFHARLLSHVRYLIICSPRPLFP